MDAFSIIVFGGLAAGLLALLALGKWSSRRTSDITNKKQHRAWDEMTRIEEHDIPQMIDAQNVYRRRRGEPEVTEQEIRARVGAQEAQRLDQADAEAKQRQRR